MYIEEEVGRKTSSIEVEDWERAYKEIKTILENRFLFDRVEEEKFRHHVERGLIISKVSCYMEMDDFTNIEVTLMLNIHQDDEGLGAVITVDSKGEIVTKYPDKNGNQRSVWYYAFRSIWDKFVYGGARQKWKDDAFQVMSDVHYELRGFLEGI